MQSSARKTLPTNWLAMLIKKQVSIIIVHIFKNYHLAIKISSNHKDFCICLLLHWHSRMIFKIVPYMFKGKMLLFFPYYYRSQQFTRQFFYTKFYFLSEYYLYLFLFVLFSWNGQSSLKTSFWVQRLCNPHPYFHCAISISIKIKGEQKLYFTLWSFVFKHAYVQGIHFFFFFLQLWARPFIVINFQVLLNLMLNPKLCILLIADRFNHYPLYEALQPLKHPGEKSQEKHWWYNRQLNVYWMNEWISRCIRIHMLMPLYAIINIVFTLKNSNTVFWTLHVLSHCTFNYVSDDKQVV